MYNNYRHNPPERVSGVVRFRRSKAINHYRFFFPTTVVRIGDDVLTRLVWSPPDSYRSCVIYHAPESPGAGRPVRRRFVIVDNNNIHETPNDCGNDSFCLFFVYFPPSAEVSDVFFTIRRVYFEIRARTLLPPSPNGYLGSARAVVMRFCRGRTVI